MMKSKHRTSRQADRPGNDPGTVRPLAGDAIRATASMPEEPLYTGVGKIGEEASSDSAPDISLCVWYEAFVAHNPNPVIVLDGIDTDPTKCPILYVNNQFTRMSGFVMKDLSQHQYILLNEIYARPATLTRAMHAITHKKSDITEADVHSKDGATFVFNITLIPFVEPQSQRLYLVIEMHDITSLKEMAEHGASIGADMRTILASARCLVWHAVVIDSGEDLSWTVTVHDEKACRRWLPVRAADNGPFFESVALAVHPDDRVRINGTAERAMHSDQTGYGQEFRVKLETGEWRWLSEDVQIEKVTPHRWHLIGVITDVNELKKAEERVAEERNLLRTVIDNIPDGIYYKDTRGRFVINNSVHTQMLGQSNPEQVLGHTEFDFLPSEAASRLEAQEMAIIQSGEPIINNEEPVVLPNNRHIWQASTKVPLRDASGSVIGVVGITRDVTERKRLESERERLLADAIERADRDPLTGLWNHRAFQKRLKDEADLARHRGTSLAVVVLDMDNFKFFNDSYGHPVGDDVLCLVAQTLYNACRSEDTVARFGGDEFAILMPISDSYAVQERVRQIVDSLRDLGYQPPGHASVVPVRLSFGLSIFPEEASSRLDALALADERLLMAKSGENEASAMAERITTDLATDPGFSMLRALVYSVDKKDRYTRHHSEDVLLYATQIAREIGLDVERIREIQVAALLHDVGKIGVQDNILRKPSGLTTMEFEAVKKHPTMGAILVGSVPGFEAALAAVRHHHERWDGQGYPEGLAADDIPLTARLMAVADAFSAMTTDRPYRKGMSAEQALNILRRGAGTQWDAQFVDAFIAVRERQSSGDAPE